MSIRLETVPTLDGRTDRQDRITCINERSHVWILSLSEMKVRSTKLSCELLSHKRVEMSRKRCKVAKRHL